MLKVLTTIFTLTVSANVMAQSALTFDNLAKNETTKNGFSQMMKGHKLPDWVRNGGTVSPTHTIKLGAETYQVFSACKPHDCASERIAVIWSEKSKQMSGVFSRVDEKSSRENLTWLNISDELSIDGKTVLFAALSGSLENHPDAFNYSE
ncbi:Ivy family C-type lysozyme inhibitor [Salmonella enterica]